VPDYSPYIAAVIGFLNLVLAALAAFGVMTLTPTEQTALSAIFASLGSGALLFIPVFIHVKAVTMIKAKNGVYQMPKSSTSGK
jgi:hypothetical protein